MTYGFAITNLFNQVADVPVANVANAIQPVATGRYYCLTREHLDRDRLHAVPVGVGSACQPYIVFPNQPPISVRIYLQMKL